MFGKKDTMNTPTSTNIRTLKMKNEGEEEEEKLSMLTVYGENGTF
jgi:hypothetical protein